MWNRYHYDIRHPHSNAGWSNRWPILNVKTLVHPHFCEDIQMPKECILVGRSFSKKFSLRTVLRSSGCRKYELYVSTDWGSVAS